jgi:creatinine deaminase
MRASIRGAGWRRLGGALAAAYGALDSGSTIAAVPAVHHTALLAGAPAVARAGSEEGGVPIGSAMFDASGALLGRGHNQRVQRDDPSAHAETEAFRNAGRRRSYRDTTISTTLAPCWYCSGLIRQFGIRTVVVGESRTFQGGIAWLRECGVEVIDLDSQECVDLLQAFIARAPEIWDEDIGE